MKIAKIVVGIFLIFAAFQGIPENQSMSDLEGGALSAYFNDCGRCRFDTVGHKSKFNG